MLSSVLLLSLPAFLFSAVIAWLSMHAMLSKNSIREFLPFFFLSVALMFYAGAIAFEVFYDNFWLILEFSILISLIWIFINIRRKLLLQM